MLWPKLVYKLVLIVLNPKQQEQIAALGFWALVISITAIAAAGIINALFTKRRIKRKPGGPRKIPRAKRSSLPQRHRKKFKKRKRLKR